MRSDNTFFHLCLASVSQPFRERRTIGDRSKQNDSYTNERDPPEQVEQTLPAKVVETLFNVSPSATDKSGRNQVQCGDIFYVVVFRRLSK